MKIHLQPNVRLGTGTALTLLVLTAMSASVASAQTNTNAARTTRSEASAPLRYESFQLVNERNIFDANRAGSGARLGSSRSNSRSRSVQMESFNLVGTLVNDGKATAFFDGTDSSFRKAIAAGSRISAFQLVEVHPAGVRLAEGTNLIDLKVGAGFTREDRGPWRTTGVGTKYASSTSGGRINSSSSSERSSRRESDDNRSEDGSNQETRDAEPAAEPASDSEPVAASGSPMEMNDVLRKMMEKREKE
jgi:hypothetical protein